MPTDPMFDLEEALRLGNSPVDALRKWLDLPLVEEPSDDPEHETKET